MNNLKHYLLPDEITSPNLNRLLMALPQEEYTRLLPQLELVELDLGQILHEPGEALKYVYFPTTTIISLLYITEDGASSEIVGIGNEGMLGVSAFMGGDTIPSRATVVKTGKGYRLKVEVLKNEFNRGDALMHLLLRYTQALITQIALTEVCSRHHSLEQQLCRLLLLTLDRLPGNKLTMTHELIANMLGVRRQGVTEAAGRLQRAGLIDCSRGHIQILKRSGLETHCCECYQVVKTEFDRLLPTDVPK